MYDPLVYTRSSTYCLEAARPVELREINSREKKNPYKRNYLLVVRLSCGHKVFMNGHKHVGKEN